MRSWQKTLLAAAAVAAIGALPALAQPSDRNPSKPGLGWGAGGSKGAPGPIAGAGLPFLLLAGGYVLVRHYRNRHKAG